MYISIHLCILIRLSSWHRINCPDTKTTPTCTLKANTASPHFLHFNTQTISFWATSAKHPADPHPSMLGPLHPFPFFHFLLLLPAYRKDEKLTEGGRHIRADKSRVHQHAGSGDMIQHTHLRYFSKILCFLCNKGPSITDWIVALKRGGAKTANFR